MYVILTLQVKQNMCGSVNAFQRSIRSYKHIYIFKVEVHLSTCIPKATHGRSFS